MALPLLVLLSAVMAVIPILMADKMDLRRLQKNVRYMDFPPENQRF